MPSYSRRHVLSMLGAAGAALTLPSLSFASDKTITCNWDKTFPPYSMERDGRMTGILVECMDEILGKRMGYTVEHKGYAWPEAQTMVSRGQGDVLCTNDTDEREQYMVFCKEPVVESLPSVFFAADNPRMSDIQAIDSVDDLKGFRQVDYAGNGWAQRTFPAYLNITYVETLKDVIHMIARGEADIFVGNGLAAMYAIKQEGLKKKIQARELPVGEPSSFRFGVRLDYPDAQTLVADFQAALDSAQEAEATRNIILNYL